MQLEEILRLSKHPKNKKPDPKVLPARGIWISNKSNSIERQQAALVL